MQWVIFISDDLGSRIRKVDSRTGIISTIAGVNKPGFNGDNIPATSAQIKRPSGIATDKSGNIYFSDGENFRVRKVDAVTGIITTIAGNGEGGFKGDEGLATNAQLYPSSIAVDSIGDVYIADWHRLRMVNPNTGIIITIAGDTNRGYQGDSGLAINSKFNGIAGIAFDKQGNIYLVDCDNQRIRKIDAKTKVVTTIAGSGYYGDGGDGELATAVDMKWPSGIAIDSIGNIYINDRNNRKIRKMDIKTGIMYTVVGNGNSGDLGDGGSAIRAELGLPIGMTFDKSGNLYIADMYHRVYKVTFFNSR